MKVLFVGLARTIWLFELALLNPTGMSLKGVIEEIGKRYRFAKVPAIFEPILTKIAVSPSKPGRLLAQGKFHSSLLLTFTTTVWWETRCPRQTSLLISWNDLGKWLSDTYGLTAPKDRRVNYVSQIDFQMEQPLANLNPQLQPFAEVIEGYVNTKNPLELSSLQFWPEGFGKPGSPAPIKIERKISAPFSANHYFSQAPLATSDHITLLTKFEALLKLEMK